MKTLVLVGHPDLPHSIVNKRWLQELKRYPELYTIHDLYTTYPTKVFDIAAEQALIEAYDHLVFQFPIYWFNCPPLIKKYLDDILTHGWAYGRTGNKLTHKKITLAVTAGIKERDYQPNGRYKHSLTQLLVPFEATFDYIHADYRPFYAFYGAAFNPSKNVLTKSAQDYVRFLQDL